MSFRLTINFLMLTCISFSVVFCSWDMQNYGPFEYKFGSLQKIKGYKSKNLADANIVFNMDQHGVYEVIGNLTVLQNTGPISEDVKYFKMTDGRYKPIFSITSSKMCDISVMSDYINKFPLHDGNCGLKKGFAEIRLNVTGNMDAIFGGKFFYGKYKLHFIAYTPKGNIFAYVVLFETFPKTEATKP